MELWNGKPVEQPSQNVRVSQPIANQHQVSQSDYLDNSNI